MPPETSADMANIACDHQVFDDPATGVYFESPEGTFPERDRGGELAFRPVSYTPWPVEAGTPGERLRIDVGPASKTSPRTFIFDRYPSRSINKDASYLSSLC